MIAVLFSIDEFCLKSIHECNTIYVHCIYPHKEYSRLLLSQPCIDCLKLYFYKTCIDANIYPKRIEYILEWNLLEKKWKTAILLYCFHTAGVLHIFMLNNLLGPGISFYRKSKINVKRKPNYEIGWFHN